MKIQCNKTNNINFVNKTKFQDQALIRGSNESILKEWVPNHFNNSHMHDVDLFLYAQKSDEVIGVEHNRTRG
jgi:hypothetical protein